MSVPLLRLLAFQIRHVTTHTAFLICLLIGLLPTAALFVNHPFTPIIVDCDKVVSGSGIRGNPNNKDIVCREACLSKCGPTAITRADWKECLNRYGLGTCRFGGQVLAETLEGQACNSPETSVVLSFPFVPETSANGTIDHYWYISRIAVRWETEVPPYSHCVNSTRHARVIQDGFPITEYPPRKWCATNESFMKQFDDGGKGQYGSTWTNIDEHWMAFDSSDYADLVFFRSQKSNFSIQVIVGSCGARVLGDPAKALVGFYLVVEDIDWNDSDEATITHTLDPGAYQLSTTAA